MAFVLDQQRPVASQRPARRNGSAAKVVESASTLLPSDVIRRLIGLVLTGLVHVALLLLLILNVFGRQDIIPKPIAPGLQLIDLASLMAQQPDEAPRAESSTAQPAAANEATVTQATPAEWSRSKVRVVEEPADTTVVASTDEHSLPSSGKAGGGGGANGFDPYAGAGQIWTSSFMQMMTRSAAPSVDGAVRRITEILRAKRPALRGTVSLRVVIAADGTITSAQYIDGTLGRSAQVQTVAALVGQRVGAGAEARALETGPLTIS